MIGTTISHYRILEHLGSGGMGIVYKAEDISLKRTVALKFLPRGLETHDVERARFLQEAQAASALNHPNVCTIHEISEHEGQQFIVMEFVDGVTLRAKIAEGGLRLSECLSYAIQIAEALEEAHGKGIVHRDVKAENIMVNTKNQIKVMDFGLAKLKGSLKLTRTSSTVGTLAYMAPEQIEGVGSDGRSDIFSFGVVLYEMLTAHLPFRGEHETAMMYSIINEEPEPATVYRPDLPSELQHILNRSLEKDPEDRYQSVHEMLIDLRRVRKESSRVVRPHQGELPSIEHRTQPRTIPQAPQPRKRLPWVIAGIGVVIIAAALALLLLHTKSPRLNPRLTGRTLELPFTEIAIPDISPDGKWIAFPARDAPLVWSVYFMNVAKGDPRRLTTDSTSTMDYAEISPDGSEIVYGSDTGLFVVSSLGGTRRRLTHLGMCPHWRPDGLLIGYIVVAGPQSGKREFWTIKPDGADARREFVDTLARTGAATFDWSPDGNSIAWVRPFFGQARFEEIFIRDLRTGDERQLTSFGKRLDEISWASNGQIFFCSNRNGNMNIWMIPASGGEAVQVTTGNGPDIAGRISADGKRFLYLEQRAIGNVWTAHVDGSSVQQVTSDYQRFIAPNFSPDNARICVTVLSSDIFRGGSQVFLINPGQESRTQLTRGSYYYFNGIWSPDGKWIVYTRRNLGDPFDSTIVFITNLSSPETPTRIGRGFFGWWLNRELLMVIEPTASGGVRSVVYSLQTHTVVDTSPDSTLRFPLETKGDTLVSDGRGGRTGWWLTRAAGRGAGHATLLLPEGDASRAWPSFSHRYLLYLSTDGGVYRLSLSDAKRTRLPKVLDGLDPTAGNCTLTYDDKELIFVKSRLESRLGLLEEVFE